MTMGSRLAEALAARQMKAPELISGLGVSKGAIYNILKDDTRPEKVWADTVFRVCGFLRINPQWLLYNMGDMDAPASSDGDYTDVIGYSQAVGLGAAGAEAVEYAETHSLKFKKSSLRKRGILNRPLAVYYGKGDSMEPAINDGDAILFDTSDTRVVDGVLYVIQVDGAGNPEYYVKRAMMLDAGVYFASDNPNGDHTWRKPKAMDNKRHPITVIGRVHWVGGWAD